MKYYKTEIFVERTKLTHSNILFRFFYKVISEKMYRLMNFDEF